MGTMTFAEMRDELMFALDNRGETTASGVTPARKSRWINSAYRHVSMPSVFRHRELEVSQDVTLVTSTASYSLNSDLWAIQSVYNTTSLRERRLRPRSMRQLDSMLTTLGEPTLYARWGNTIHLRRVPSSSFNGDTLRVRYWDRPSLLSADSDLSVLTDEWDEIIIMGARWRGWLWMNVPDRAEQARQDFGRMINEITDTFQLEGEDTDWNPEVYVDDPMAHASRHS